MKRFLCMMLCLSLLALTACGSDPTPTTVPTTEPTTVPTTAPTQPVTEPDHTIPPVTEPIIYDLPMAAITLTEEAETAADTAGNTVFTYTYQNIRLYLENESVSEAVTLDLLNRIDSTRTAANRILADADSATSDAPFFFTVLYAPERVDSSILSFSGLQTSYNGGVHPNSSCVGVTYDLLTGHVLQLGDILADDCTADVICRLVVDALNTIAEERFLYEDFSATVEERFSRDFRADESWYLSRDGLCFDFAPYEIAPYASGIVTAVITYDDLTGILNDAWFPLERVSPDGELNAILFDDADHDSYQQFVDVVLEPEGERFLLSTDGLIYDVTIEFGHWNLPGTVYVPEFTVFSADSLIPSDAVMIQTDIPDTLPNIRITYTSADGTKQIYLSQSGEDGSALLLSY